MDLNFVKIKRRFRYFKDIAKYSFMNVFTKAEKPSEDDIRRFETRSRNADTDELAYLGSIAEGFVERVLPDLNGIAGETDVLLYYSGDKEDTDIPNAFNTAGSEYTIISTDNMKIGVALFDISDITTESFNILQKNITGKRKALKKEGVDVKIAYVIGEQEGSKISGKIKKHIGTFGFDHVVSVTGRIKGKKNFRTITFGETRVMYGLGTIGFPMADPEDKFDINALPILIYRESIVKNEKGTNVKREGFVPAVAWFGDKGINEIKELKKDSFENESEEGRYVQIELLMNGFRNFRELITLGEIFDIIGETMPEKYEYLRDHCVNQICARTYELAPGSIFFFRPQFKDHNDLKIEKEFMRNRLILKAITRKALFTFTYKKLPRFMPHMVISDPMEAHIKVMSWYRQKFIKARYIGITGSVGKTSTKDMLWNVLDMKYKTARSVRNQNVQVKIGISEQSMRSDTEIFVQEIGGGRPGGASRHSRMVLPEICIITNIGTAHIGNYKSQEDLMRNKLMITDGMPKNGVLFLNGDDPLLSTAETHHETIYFAIDNHNADCYAENIVESAGRTEFDIIYGEEKSHAVINVPGGYNVLNAVCAYAVARHIGMKPKDILEGMLNFETSGVRQNLMTVGGYTIFADCYNASANSVESSLSVLETLEPKKNGSRIAVIGDVTGMGEQLDNINDLVAQSIDRHKVDRLMLYGNNTKDVYNKIDAAGIGTIDMIGMDNPQKMETWMTENVKPEDVLLVKGSGKMKFDAMIDAVFGCNLSDRILLDESKYSVYHKDELSYWVFEDHITVYRYYGMKEEVVLPNHVFHKRVTKITRRAFFEDAYLKRIKMGDEMLHISALSFSGCKQLESVEFGPNVKYIAEEAFSNCPKLEEIVLPRSIRHLEAGVFAGCGNLKTIKVPSTAGYIDDKAFENCEAEITYY